MQELLKIIEMLTNLKKRKRRMLARSLKKQIQGARKEVSLETLTHNIKEMVIVLV